MSSNDEILRQQQLIQRNPNSPDHQVALSRLLFDAGRLEESAAAMRRAIDLNSVQREVCCNNHWA